MEAETIDCVIKLGGSALTDKKQKEILNETLFEPYGLLSIYCAASPCFNDLTIYLKDLKCIS